MVTRAFQGLLILWPIVLSFAAETWGAEIVGRITDIQTGNGIPRAVVRAMPEQRNRREIQAETDVAGRYTLELLRGRYRLFISVPNSNYMSQFYSASGEGQGDIIDVPTFQSFSIINSALRSGGSIAGSVRRLSDNAPVNNARVYAEAASGRVSVTTREDGNFVFRALPPDTYRLWVVTLGENYVSLYFDDAVDSNRAELIQLGRGQEITGIDFRPRHGGTIGGRVYARKNREPISGLKIIVEKENSTELPLFTYTDAQGFYSVHGLTDGMYIVETGPPKNPQARSQKRYLTQYYDSRFDKELATKLRIEFGGSLTGVNFSLVAGGGVVGRAQSRDHSRPMADVEILPQQSTEEILYSPIGKTNEKGWYSLENLPPGEYTLESSLPEKFQRFIKVFYRDKLSLERADKVTVEESETVRDIDFDFTLGTTLKGWVKVDDPEYRFTPSNDAMTLKRLGIDVDGFGERDFKLNPDGSFVIEGTPAGRYSLNPKILDPNLAPRRNADGKILDLAEGDTVEGLEFVLKVGGSISGKISTQHSFYTLDKLLLVLIGLRDNKRTYFDLPSEHFTIAGLSAGRYVLVLLSNPEKTHPAENFQPTRVFDTRTVEVSKGKTTRGVDFQIVSLKENQQGLFP